MRIGIFGGSFSPIHNGHLRLARAAHSELNLDRVIFVPSFLTPLKSQELLPAAFRVRLLRLAIKPYPFFSVSLCEMKRGDVSYTVDTLRFLKRRLGSKAELYFLCGQDTLKTIPRWKSFDKIVRLCHFVVMSRPGVRVKTMSGPWNWIGFDALPISASRVRKKLSQGQLVRGLVPTAVERELSGYYKKMKRSASSKRKRR